VPECKDIVPSGKATWLYQANANSNSATLRFINWQSPTSYFALEYGIKSGEYQFGVNSFGDANTTSYIINDLSPNTTYYFRVRTGNGCATGDWSNEISVKTLGWFSFNEVEVVDTQIEINETEADSSDCQTYIVKQGDTLWSIAQGELGNGSRYGEIVEANKAEYPSLETLNNISKDWKLRINCSQEKEKDAKEELTQDGYDVNIKVMDTEQQPLEGVNVTLHSKVQEATTNKDGIAEFSNVEPGDHRVIIAYSDYEGEQTLNLSGDVKEFNVNITISTKKTVFSPISLSIIGVLAVTLVSVVAILIKKKK